MIQKILGQKLSKRSLTAQSDFILKTPQSQILTQATEKWERKTNICKWKKYVQTKL